MDKSTFLVRVLRDLDMNLRNRAERIAKKRKVAFSSLIRTAIIEWLKEQETQEKMERDWREITQRK